MPHPIEVPHPSETKVTSETVIKAHTPHTTDEASHIDDVEVTPHVKTHVTVVALKDPFVYTGGGFPGWPIDTSILTGYADHVAFRLWQGEICL